MTAAPSAPTSPHYHRPQPSPLRPHLNGEICAQALHDNDAVAGLDDTAVDALADDALQHLFAASSNVSKHRGDPANQVQLARYRATLLRGNGRP